MNNSDHTSPNSEVDLVDEYVPEFALSEDDWEEMQSRANFSADQLTEARTMIEMSIGEYLHHESDPYGIPAKKAVLHKLMSKIDALGEELNNLSLDDETYWMLVDDNSQMIPATFASGGDHPGHQDLVKLLDGLRVMADRIEGLVSSMPRKKRGPQNQNLVRLMLRIDQTIRKCTDRPGLSLSKKRIISNKYSARDLAAYICICAATQSALIEDSLIELAIEEAIALIKNHSNEMQKALGPYSIYNVLFGDSIKDV